MHLPGRVLHYFKNQELDELYASTALKSLALGMINIFIPIFLINLGYSFYSVLFFYVIVNIAQVLMVIPAAKIACRFGFKHGILFSVPILIIFYFLLYTLEVHRLPLFFLGIVLGVYQALFWTAYHIDFAKFSEKGRRGEEIGFSRIVGSLAAVFGPAIGGLTLVLFGFNTLFIITSLVLTASVIPLFFSRDMHEPINFSAKKVLLNQKKNDYIGLVAEGVEGGAAVLLWPVFIFFAILKNYASLGFVTSFSFLFSLLFVFVIGRFSDVKRELVFKLGALGSAIVWIFRIFVKTLPQILIIDAIYGMVQTMKVITFDAKSYDKANESRLVEGIAFREIMIPFGRILLFLAMMVFTNYAFGFGAASLGAFFLLYF